MQWQARPCAVADAVAGTDHAQGTRTVVCCPKASCSRRCSRTRANLSSPCYQAHQTPVANFNAGLAAIGDNFPFLRGRLGAGTAEVGVQAGIFSLFNLDSGSSDLINTDFVVGFPLTYRLGPFSARAFVYHLDVVAAGDFQGFEELDWEVDRSYRLGLAYRRDDMREVRLMAEYFDGFSPNGQSFRSRLKYTGVGLYLDYSQEDVEKSPSGAARSR